jgi:hypothetical protein
MPLRLEAVTFDAHDPGAVAAFWAALLDPEAVTEDGGVLLPGGETQVGLRFVAAPGGELGTHRLHLHLTSTSLEDQQRQVDRALALGGRHDDVGQTEADRFVVLADPGGNHLCVIEPGNSFLAGCGPLGEVTCDGTRDVGIFWSAALGWPLVWDQDEETAIQSPLGGTKVAWGGPPLTPKDGRNRQRFALVADDVPAEVERLVALGATRLTDQDGVAELADPDGNELSVS